MTIKSFRYRLDISRFVLRRVDGALRLELDAVLDTNAPLASVQLAIRGREPLVLSGSSDAPTEPLTLQASLAAEDAPELDDATIEIVSGNGDAVVFDVGDLLRRPDWLPRLVTLDCVGADDPLSLTPPDAGALAEAIETGFGAIDADDLFAHYAEGAWRATSHRYGLTVGAFASPDLDGDDPRARIAERVRERARALLADLSADAPLLLVEGTPADTDETVSRLHDVLRARNPDATLLWLDPHRPPGPVARYHRAGDDVPPRRGLLLAGAGTGRDALLAAARDDLLAP